MTDVGVVRRSGCRIEGESCSEDNVYTHVNTVDNCVDASHTARPSSATMVSAEPFSHGTGTLRCLQKEMATYRH